MGVERGGQQEFIFPLEFPIRYLLLTVLLEKNVLQCEVVN